MEPEAEPAAAEPEETPAPGAKPGAKAATPGAKAGLPDKRVKAMYKTPAAAASEIAELSELSKLVEASPAVSKLLSDEDLVATIFAPNNDVSWLRGQRNYPTASQDGLLVGWLHTLGRRGRVVANCHHSDDTAQLQHRAAT